VTTGLALIVKDRWEMKHVSQHSD